MTAKKREKRSLCARCHRPTWHDSDHRRWNEQVGADHLGRGPEWAREICWANGPAVCDEVETKRAEWDRAQGGAP